MSLPFQTAVVTGASRGFGRALCAALVATGTSVIGIALDKSELRAVRDELGEGFTFAVGAGGGWSSSDASPGARCPRSWCGWSGCWWRGR
ncbi:MULTISPECIES: SDR family NAD(P)-dependent oxidoreductase [unclassified Streptomyces]|uniref:SDR family NAD(P)-dependent oxidoreductase n=1 Tax=unclassified Streptomyces TaxID=2593676 RepID=UPI00386690D9